MGNKRKESWLLKDPNFVPKNKKVRVVLYLIINLILISLLPILAIVINFPYGYLCWILVFCFLILFNIQAFYIHVERFPLNDYNEYKVNLKQEQFLFDGENYYVELKKNDSLYEINFENKSIMFDMNGCLFPITVIKAYLGRLFIIKYINKYKLYSDWMAKNIDIKKLFKNYSDIKFIYNKNGKIKESYLIKCGKTQMNILMKAINGHGFISWHSGSAPSRSIRYYVKISEQMFVEQKSKNK